MCWFAGIILALALLTPLSMASAAPPDGAACQSSCNAGRACGLRITEACLRLTPKAVCPPTHRCVTPLLPADCRKPAARCHKPLQTCMPECQPCALRRCHKPVVGLQLEVCGCETKPERRGGRKLIAATVHEDCGCECSKCSDS